MSRKPPSKRTRPKPKAVLRLPDLDQAKSAVLNSLTSADAQTEDTDTQLMNSWTGTARNLGSLSIGLSCSVIEFISKAAGSLQGQSIFA
jgi:hypothetical protein